MPCARATLSDEVVRTIKTSTNTSAGQQHPQDNNNDQSSSNSSSSSLACRQVKNQIEKQKQKQIERNRSQSRVKQINEQKKKKKNSTTNTLKTSIYDWDSPSSFTGTIKRRPHSNALTRVRNTTNSDDELSTPLSSSSSSSSANKGDQARLQLTNNAGSRPKQLHKQQVNNNNDREAVGYFKLLQKDTKMSDQESPTPPSTRSKEKPNKLRLTKSDRNANSTTLDNCDNHTDGMAEHDDQQMVRSSSSGAKPKTINVLQPKTENINNTPRKKSKFNGGPEGYSNYMELDFCEQNGAAMQFTEFFSDFPVSYATTNLGASNQFPPNKPPPQPPPYRDPPPPTPPPLSQIPSRENRLLAQSAAASISAPNTPSRGKVVLSKKERKELNKQLSKHQQLHQQPTAELLGLATTQEISVSAQSSPYKGRVTELKNCIAKINSRGLFASLHRSSQKSLSHAQADDMPSSSEISPPPPAPDHSPDGGSTLISTNNNDDDDADYTEKLKNLPVRQRKAITSHMDNYCLFDPVDFINEKALRYHNQASTSLNTTGLRDPLFSSRQHLVFDEEEMVPEVIYDDQDIEEETIIIETSEEPDAETEAVGNFEHHNYFVIDPDDFEQEPLVDIGIPNPFTNEQIINAKLATVISNQDSDLHASASLEKLLSAFEDAPSMSNSQESKDTNTTTSTTDTTSTALVESSTSSNSSSSQVSTQAIVHQAGTSAQTTLRRAKKKLTFLNLSPFRMQKPSVEEDSKDQQPNDNKTNERAISELVSGDHLLHLQNMLQNANSRDKDLRAHTVPIESNYVLFNPGPVPSRNVQYKIRKPRPLSTHSDADSGFLSPCSPEDLRANPAVLVLQQCDSVQGYIEIYTDWANYYLERAKSKKKVTDLSADCRDGLLLADVIEAVTSFKVPDLVKKPKNQQQMYDNVNSCLKVLRSQTVAGLDNITTSDICAGRLKAVLALFFALSRFKQQAKQTKSIGVGVCNAGVGGSVVGVGVGGSLRQPSVSVLDKHQVQQQQQQTHQQQTNAATNANVVHDTTNSTTASTATAAVNQQQQQQQQQEQHAQSVQNGNEMVNRQIPTAYSKANGGTAIPLPATVMVQRRCPPDKVRPLPPTPNHTPTIPGLGKNGSEFNSSRPNSPPTTNHTIQSLKSGNNNGLRPPTVKATHQSSIPSPSGAGGSSAAVTNAPPPQKHSMLDKLKLFNKEKQQQQATNMATNKTQVQSKRTSSSSGFSSARSERSDSSLSLNDGHISQIKPPTVSVTASKVQKNNTKQSKLLAAQQKKDTAKASKLEKASKERSPARSLREESGMESRTSTLSRTAKNSLPRTIAEKNTSKTSSKSSLHTKSESKSSLIIPAAKNLHSPSGTGLPKPIAAIKGTSKLPQPGDNKSRISHSNSQHELLKRQRSDISSVSAQTASISDQQQHRPATPQGMPVAASAATQTQHIVNSVPVLPESGGVKPPPPPYYANTPNISQTGYLSEPNTPQHFQRLLQPEPTYGSRLASPKSGLASSSPRKLEYNSGPGILSPQRLPMRPSNQPQLLSNTLPNGHNPHNPNSASLTPSAGDLASNKFHTIPSKVGLGVGVGGTIYEMQEEKPVSVLPMLPLLRGYNSHVTLPTRGNRGQQHQQHQYLPPSAAVDFNESDIGQGYCSDGDALRVINAHDRGRGVSTASRFHDIDNGYLSEGSSGIGTSSLGGAHGKHFLNLMRARTQLPTTIEERIRNSRGSLDSIGTAPPSSAASQASSSGGSTAAVKMDASGSGSANGSPQHHHHQHHQHGQHRSSSRSSGRDNWSKMAEPLNGQKADKGEKSSPSRRSLGGNGGGSGSSSKQGSPSGRTKGVPPSFGYVKRSNGSITSTAEQQNILMMGGGGGCGVPNGLPSGRTAHVSAVPRSAGGRKMGGGTQTLPNDMTKSPANTQHRSFSLTGPSATQLSQSIRERLATGSHSLPKPGSDMHMFQHRVGNRSGKLHDGSLSDTQTYAEVKPEYSSYAMWLKHSNTAGSRLSEGDSIENMQIGSPAMTRHGHKMIHNRSGTTAAGGGVAHMPGSESPYVQSPRLNRSNSIRSTKSEKMYPSMLSRGPDVEIEPYYCLPVGTIAAGQNGVISAQMAAAAAAAAAHAVAGGAVGQGQPGMAGGAPIAWSQPTSPTPVNRGFGGPLSPTHGAVTLGGHGLTGGNATAAAAGLTGAGGHRLTYPKKNDDVHGSAASLLSGGSSLYGSAEERQAHEIRRLKRELMDAREQVLSLSSQLSTNAHVVSAFEQSLSNMTNRLHQLTATAERKDGELTDMRQTIELLRKQSIQAGLTTAHMQSMGVQTQSQNQNELLANPIGNSNGKPPPLPPAMPGRSGVAGSANTMPNNAGAMQRHHSTDSMCSLNSISSGCSAADKKQKKKGWLRSSFTKAFSRNAKISKTSRHVGHHHPHHLHGSVPEHGSVHGSPKANGHGHFEPAGLAALATQPAPPLPSSPTKSSPAKTVTLIENAKPIDAIDEEHQMVEDLKKQLREKDLVLTDIRLEALSSASQLESLKETVNKMRAEMLSLKQNNERLQKLVTTRSLAGSEASLGNAISPNGSIGDSRRYSLADGNARPPMELPKRLEEEVEEENIPPAPAPDPQPPPPPLSPSTHIDLTPPPPALEPLNSPAHIPSTAEELPDMNDGKKIAIACYLGQPESFGKYCDEMFEVDDFYANSAIIASHEAKDNERKVFPTANLNEFVIAYTYISGKTTWQNLDYIVRKTFKDYVARIDPGTNLGLNTDSITSYHLGEAKRGPEMGFPELLPCGYIIGSVRTLYICLQGVGSLAFDSLIPRSIVHRYISLLTEHRRLILCGPSGTGKSYLARRLAEFLVARSGRGNPSEAIATFNVDHKSSKDLRQYLSHIAEQAAIANGASELPSVIILDNLHHASALGDVFSSLLSAGPAAKLPCIIGTMSQATCNTTNLQLHHNFRWVLTANHMEPVKGFLGRFLRRRLFQLELQTQHPQPELATVLAWLPTVWQHINRFLEVHSSSDVTIGPRLFLSCPLDLKDSQVWFTDIWNYHLSPYLVEAVREGVQLYGRRGGAWNDPSAFIRNSYPWPYGPDSVPPLRQINAEDVGLEGVASNSGENQDPLLNMLMRLQEAANYSENQDQESDCASLDSNITPDSSAGAE